MSISFSRSMRSISNDGFRFSLVGLITFLIMLTAWLIWFFTAGIPNYEKSSQFDFNRDGTLQVTFSNQALSKIQAGQKATLKVANSGTIIDAIVSSVDSQNKKGTVKIYLLYEEPVDPKTQGEVQVEVEMLTPAGMLTRMLGTTTQAQ